MHLPTLPQNAPAYPVKTQNVKFLKPQLAFTTPLPFKGGQEKPKGTQKAKLAHNFTIKNSNKALYGNMGKHNQSRNKLRNYFSGKTLGSGSSRDSTVEGGSCLTVNNIMLNARRHCRKMHGAESHFAYVSRNPKQLAPSKTFKGFKGNQKFCVTSKNMFKVKRDVTKANFNPRSSMDEQLLDEIGHNFQNQAILTKINSPDKTLSEKCKNELIASFRNQEKPRKNSNRESLRYSPFKSQEGGPEYSETTDSWGVKLNPHFNDFVQKRRMKILLNESNQNEENKSRMSQSSDDLCLL